jgi:hypothetical protein
MQTASEIEVAVLYQALEPPIINGVRKPRNPGGICSKHTI